MTKFYTLNVADVVNETTDSVSLGFIIPKELKETFKYKQGQYLTLKFNVNGQDLRRSYSISSSPVVDEKLQVTIKRVKDGRVSNFINDNIKFGDAIEVMPPMGNFFTELNPINKKTYVLFGGGSGITPMLSILKTSLEVEPLSKVVLFYGNRNIQSIIFADQIANLEKKHPDRLKVYYILEDTSDSNDLLKGIMSVEKTKKLIESFINRSETNEFFVCGPTPMMMNVEQTLNELEFPKSNIHLEYFSAPADTSEIIENHSGIISTNESFHSTVTIICDGDERVVEMEADDIILNKALEANLDAPYACRGGSCCTCRAKLIEGKVEMKVNYALQPDEVKQGYILTCQSRPLTPIVIVDYDQGR